MPNNCNMPKDKIFFKMLSEYAKLSESHIEMLQKVEKFRLALEKAKDHHLQHWNLSEGRFMVLMAIWNCESGAIKATDIAQQLGVTKATMTGLIDSLVASDMIEKFDCTEDRRASFIKLTPEGDKFLKTMLPEHVSCLKEFTQKLSSSEAAQLSALLDKLTTGFTAFDV